MKSSVWILNHFYFDVFTPQKQSLDGHSTGSRSTRSSLTMTENELDHDMSLHNHEDQQGRCNISLMMTMMMMASCNTLVPASAGHSWTSDLLFRIVFMSHILYLIQTAEHPKPDCMVCLHPTFI